MRRKNPTLEDDVSAAFERACREQDFVVAEYLLQALEAIAKRNGDEGGLQHAYAVLIHAMPSCGRHS